VAGKRLAKGTGGIGCETSELSFENKKIDILTALQMVISDICTYIYIYNIYYIYIYVYIYIT
jgi:hypothetical protein